MGGEHLICFFVLFLSVTIVLSQKVMTLQVGYNPLVLPLD